MSMTDPAARSLAQLVRRYLEARPEGRCDRCVAAGLGRRDRNVMTRVNQCSSQLVARYGFRRQRTQCPGCKRPRIVTMAEPPSTL